MHLAFISYSQYNTLDIDTTLTGDTLDLYVVSTRYSDLDAGTLGIRLGLGNISYTGGNLRNETFQGHLLEQ